MSPRTGEPMNHHHTDLDKNIYKYKVQSCSQKRPKSELPQAALNTLLSMAFGLLFVLLYLNSVGCLCSYPYTGLHLWLTHPGHYSPGSLGFLNCTDLWFQCLLFIIYLVYGPKEFAIDLQDQYFPTFYSSYFIAQRTYKVLFPGRTELYVTCIMKYVQSEWNNSYEWNTSREKVESREGLTCLQTYTELCIMHGK